MAFGSFAPKIAQEVHPSNGGGGRRMLRKPDLCYTTEHSKERESNRLREVNPMKGQNNGNEVKRGNRRDSSKW